MSFILNLRHKCNDKAWPTKGFLLWERLKSALVTKDNILWSVFWGFSSDRLKSFLNFPHSVFCDTAIETSDFNIDNFLARLSGVQNTLCKHFTNRVCSIRTETWQGFVLLQTSRTQRCRWWDVSESMIKPRKCFQEIHGRQKRTAATIKKKHRVLYSALNREVNGCLKKEKERIKDCCNWLDLWK